MKIRTVILISVFGMFLFSCGPSAEEKSKMESLHPEETRLQDSISSALLSSSSAVENKKDTTDPKIYSYS